MDRKVVSAKNLPVKIPLMDGVILYLLLDQLRAVPWMWGVVGTLYVIVVLCTIYVTWCEEDIEIFKKE